MDQGRAEVIVDGQRCSVLQADGERVLIQPMTARGFGINVKRWVTSAETEPVAVVAAKPSIPLVMSDDEIRHLAAVLRQVFYDDSDSATKFMSS